MDEARPLLAPATRARVHAPRLEIAAGGAARNLAVGALPRQPDLDVEGPPGGEAHVAGAERDHPVRQAEALQHRFGGAGHALLFGVRLFRRRDTDQLDLAELVLPDHAARVAAGGARPGPEAGRPRGETEGQRPRSEERR